MDQYPSMQDSALRVRGQMVDPDAGHRPPGIILGEFVSPNFEMLGDPRVTRATEFAGRAILDYKASSVDQNGGLVIIERDQDGKPVLGPNNMPIIRRLSWPSRGELREQKKLLRKAKRQGPKEKALKRDLRRLGKIGSALKQEMDSGNQGPAHAYYGTRAEIAAKRDQLDTLRDQRRRKVAESKEAMRQLKGNKRERRAFVRALAWHGIHPESKRVDTYISQLPWRQRRKARKIARETFEQHHYARNLEGLRYDSAKEEMLVGTLRNIQRGRKVHRDILREIDYDLRGGRLRVWGGAVRQWGSAAANRLGAGTARAARGTARAVGSSARAIARAARSSARGAARLGERLMDPQPPRALVRAGRRLRAEARLQQINLDRQRESLRDEQEALDAELESREERRADRRRYRASMRRARAMGRAARDTDHDSIERQRAIDEFDRIARERQRRAEEDN